MAACAPTPLPLPESLKRSLEGSKAAESIRADTGRHEFRERQVDGLGVGGEGENERVLLKACEGLGRKLGRVLAQG